MGEILATILEEVQQLRRQNDDLRNIINKQNVDLAELAERFEESIRWMEEERRRDLYAD